MSVRNRSHWDWEYGTYCDFGDLSRESFISKHFSLDAAKRAFKRLRKIYSHESTLSGRGDYRCWQKHRYTGQIINDTGHKDRAIYA